MPTPRGSTKARRASRVTDYGRRRWPPIAPARVRFGPSKPSAEPARRWIWLLPATYVLHIAEEGLAGERFYRWVARVAGAPLPAGAFWVLNMGYVGAMTAAVLTAQRKPDAAWLVPALGTITLVNGVGHLAGSALTRSYSPGLVTGIALWAPLGALIRRRRTLASAVWRHSVVAGAGVHALVAAPALAVCSRSHDRSGPQAPADPGRTSSNRRPASPNLAS